MQLQGAAELAAAGLLSIGLCFVALLLSFDDAVQVDKARYGQFDRWVDEEMDVTENLISDTGADQDEFF